MGLAYCPFPVLAERVRQRNINAMKTGRLDDYRTPLQPLQQFCDFFKPAEPGDTVIGTLHRNRVGSEDGVEESFEAAFQQQIDFLQKRIVEGDPGAVEDKAQLEQDHDAMKKKLLGRLGFSDPSTTEVNITTSRKGINYLFNTHVMKPPAASEIIREWK